MNTSRVDVSKLSEVYSGKDGKCCCGCSGKFWDATDLKNKKMVNKVINIIDRAVDIDNGNGYVATTVGTRLYVAYYE